MTKQYNCLTQPSGTSDLGDDDTCVAGFGFMNCRLKRTGASSPNVSRICADCGHGSCGVRTLVRTNIVGCFTNGLPTR